MIKRSDRRRVCSWSGTTNWSDRSKWNPNTTRDFNRFRSCNIISCGISPRHSINIKGHGRLGYPIDQNTKQSITFIVFTFISTLAFPISTCCSSSVSMAFEDALAGLPSLGQPYACLPRRSPSRVSIRRIVVVLHGDRSDCSTQEALQGAPLRAVLSSAFVC